MDKDYFETLVALWRRDTKLLSSVQKMTEHPCYQAIIADGWGSMPWIMEDLRDNGPEHWFIALAAICGKDHAIGETTMQGATDRWLEWGREVGLIK